MGFWDTPRLVDTTIFFYNAQMSETKIKITIDTNLINSKQKLPAMNKLEQWRDEGKLEIVGTQRLKREVADYKNDIASAKEASIPNVSEPMVWDISAWGESKWGAEGEIPEYKELAKTIFPTVPLDKLNQNQQNDVMHLMGHADCDSDIFVTSNIKDFINDGRREQLKAKFQIVTMTAEEVVADFSTRYGWA